MKLGGEGRGKAGRGGAGRGGGGAGRSAHGVRVARASQTCGERDEACRTPGALGDAAGRAARKAVGRRAEAQGGTVRRKVWQGGVGRRGGKRGGPAQRAAAQDDASEHRTAHDGSGRSSVRAAWRMSGSKRCNLI